MTTNSSKRIDAGSIGGSMGVCKSHARVVKNSGVLHMQSEGKSTVQKRASISSEKSLFGTRDLKEYISHLLQNLRRVFVQTQQANSKKAMFLQILLKKAKDFLQVRSSLAKVQRMKRIPNGKEKMLDTSLLMGGYREPTDAQINARTVYNQLLDSLAQASHPIMNGLIKTK